MTLNSRYCKTNIFFRMTGSFCSASLADTNLINPPARQRKKIKNKPNYDQKNCLFVM